MTENTQDYPELLTIAEVSHILRVDNSTARRWVKQGTLEAVMLPGKEKQGYRIKREILDKLLGNQ